VAAQLGRRGGLYDLHRDAFMRDCIDPRLSFDTGHANHGFSTVIAATYAAYICV